MICVTVAQTLKPHIPMFFFNKTVKERTDPVILTCILKTLFPVSKFNIYVK